MQLKYFLEMIHDEKYKEDHSFYEVDEVNLYVGADVKVDNQVISELSDWLEKCVNLQTFSLSFGFIGISFDNELIDYGKLFNALKNCKQLKKFDISFNQFGKLSNEDIKLFCEFVEGSILEIINLRDNDLNRLSYENLSMLCIAITKCKTLNNLDISYNDFHTAEDQTFNLICDTVIACENLLYFDMPVPYISKQRNDRLLKIKSLLLNRMNHNLNSSTILEKERYSPMPIFERLQIDSLNKHSVNKSSDSTETQDVPFNLPKCNIF